MSILTILDVGLALMGWLFIMFKTGQWFVSVFLKQWDKRKKQSRRQKAVNEFYDAFDLSSIEPGTTVRLATKGDLTIMMFRQESAQ
ncbi:DUF4752 family protein [Salmonella enterica subsp. houtenae]|nr:DUF4752 family protein [Salmonella enterica]EBZ3774316.1 DUF4752 family protein [Salmonella enterica subsp. enterica serovar Minnesota]ECF2431214.1 DUF4752 family protein [Salmonella enterica subsp. enterica serovar Beaudesert]ECF3330541.1 DUF4752 family protein [Salmonella enterica subsp. enterica serovar Nima]ECJ2898034.1 DUF4752 family protein [Salmonella enterica subsp. houtenae]EDV9552893.1 DUF4752 family protein [Salmonella enterica subsp. enterica]EHJ7373157.1 DUF4752 family protein